MGMMKMIGKVGRKFRTAYMKTARPKTGPVKPLGDAGYPNSTRRNRRQDPLDRRGWETEGGPSTISKKTRVTFKGMDMKESNFMKSFKPVGGYKYGTLVSKEALRTGGKKAVADSYGRKGFTNYKTRSYQP